MINSTAIILAGGKSSRMTTNKLLLKINGQPIIDGVVGLCNSIFSKTILITNTPEEYNYINIKMFTDVYKAYGPLSGIHSGLLNSNTETNFVISGDMPFINKNIVEYLFEVKSSKQIILPKTKNKIHPLCGIYNKTSLSIAEKLLKKADDSLTGKLNEKTKIKLFDLINEAETDIIEVSNQPFYHKDLFFNMNTLEDYNYVNENFNKIMKEL